MHTKLIKSHFFILHKILSKNIMSSSQSTQDIKSFDVIKFFILRIRSYKWYYLVVVITTIMVSRADRSIPILLQDITDQIVNKAWRNDVMTIFVLMTWYRLLGLGWWRIVDRLVCKSQSMMLADLYNQMRYRVQSHSQQFFVNTFAGKLTKNMSKLARGLEDVIDTLVFNIMPIVVGTTIMTWYLWFEDKIFAIIILWRILWYLIIQYILYTWLQWYNRRFDIYDSKFSWYVADTVTNHSTIHNFAMIWSEYQYFKSQSRHLYQLLYSARNKHNIIHGINSFCILFLQFGILYLVIKGIYSGKYTLWTFVMIQTYLIWIADQMFRIWQTIKRLFVTISESTDMIQILKTPSEIQDLPHGSTLHISQGTINFDRVWFGYKGRKQLFNWFNLLIPWWQKIGIVWHSWCGKSTLIKILMRSYEIQSGQIMIDDQDITNITQQSLRSQIALVSQDPLLFHRSLAENISYAKPKATMEEIIQASCQAYCHDFISWLPHGYDTIVGERWVKLSGWERQRISLARAILANRPILILDEATSSLDSQSESMIQKSMIHAMEDKTTLVIAHRLSTLLQMDRIIVIHHGTIIQDGTHTQLIQDNDGLYASLWSKQKAWFIE